MADQENGRGRRASGRGTRTRTAARPPAAKASGPIPTQVEPSTIESRTPTTTLDGALAFAAAPAGLATSTLGADVSGQLQAVAPTFGQVLESIGQGVADSQTALDQGVVDTVKTLGNTNIQVVTDVIQHLGDDGLPDPSKTELITQNLSVLNFFMPTVHEWKRVILSMDLSVGAFDAEQGLSFSAEQSGARVGGVGMLWGFVGLAAIGKYDNSQYYNRRTEQEASWSQGQVRLDATLGPRTTGKLPIPSQAVIGPQITVAQGTVKDAPIAGGGGVKRSLDVLITVLKRDGAANPSAPITLDSGPLLPSFATTGGFAGSTTNAQGQCKVTLARNLPTAGAAPVKVPITVRLNSFSQSVTITI